FGLGPDGYQFDGHVHKSDCVQRSTRVGFGDVRVRAVEDVQQFDLHAIRSFRVRAARSPLRMTTTSAISCTSTTAASPSTPNRASGSRAAMISSDRMMFWLMMRLPRRA